MSESDLIQDTNVDQIVRINERSGLTVIGSDGNLGRHF